MAELNIRARNGATGNGIASSNVAYQASPSGEVIPTGEWSSTVVAVPPTQFLWTRTILTFTDSTTSVAYSVGSTGGQGQNATIVVSSTVTGQAGTNASVQNVGTDTNVELVFTIPRGEDGANSELHKYRLFCTADQIGEFCFIESIAPTNNATTLAEFMSEHFAGMTHCQFNYCGAGNGAATSVESDILPVGVVIRLCVGASYSNRTITSIRIVQVY